jgi:histidyl-tRNA synthetase
VKPSIPKGTRDFSPTEMLRREHIFSTIREVFRLHGYQPIETPAMELTETLMGKYGEEGDRLIFRILNSGDFTGEVNGRLMSGEYWKYFSDFVALKHRITNSIVRAVQNHATDDDFDSYVAEAFKFDQEKFEPYEDLFQVFKRYYLEIDRNRVYSRYHSICGEVSEPIIRRDVNFDLEEFFTNHNPTLEVLRRHCMILSPSEIAREISEKALRYDLTVPFARYVVMNRNDITFPFKRYQIQPVWRADRPQRGRYREFYQCDADVIGSDSLLNEVELIQIMDGVFNRLRIPVVVKLNNRKLLQAVAEAVGAPDRFVDITVAMDKLDKIGLDKVEAELRERGLTDDSITKLRPLMQFEGDVEAKVDFLRNFLAGIEIGAKGLEELTEVMGTACGLVSSNLRLEFDLTLARGLNYYTGAIIEVKSGIEGTLTGSICGGGRYDDLTGIFGMPGTSGVGISFGADRIYDVMLEAKLFPDTLAEGPRVLFVNFGKAEAARSLVLLAQLRSAGIVAELYPDPAKMKKQMGYADARNIPFVAIIGENELKDGTITLKDMRSGEQRTVRAEDLASEVR